MSRPPAARALGARDLERVVSGLSALAGVELALVDDPSGEAAAPVTLGDITVGWVCARGAPSAEEAARVTKAAAETLSLFANGARADGEALRESILATISHELRTPLTSVIGYAEMLLEGMAGEVSDSQRTYLETIVEKAQKLVQVISEIIELNLGHRRLDVTREEVDLAALTRDVVESLGAEPSRRGLELVVKAGVAPAVFADRAMVRQVLLHLIANAIKFSPEGGTVEIALALGSLRTTASAGEDPMGVRITVGDEGIGIALRDQARIFETFIQVDASSTRQFDGAGLGLSLAKRYIEAHGGSIWVESRAGEGAKFTFSLPVRAADLPP